jgi:DNA-binding SARP family transcriptional activator
MRLEILGGFQLSSFDGLSSSLLGKKARLLLAYMALQNGRALTRSQLAGLLWGDRDETRARHSLSQALSQVRRALNGRFAGAFTLTMDNVQFDPSALEVDAIELLAITSGDSQTALEQAMALFKGDLLNGLSIDEPGFESWLIGERSRFRAHAVQLMTALCEKHQREVRFDDAIQTALKLISMDPGNERACRILMNSYAAQGSTNEALRHYRIFYDQLDRELGVQPEAETQRLFREISEIRRKEPSLRKRLKKGRARVDSQPVMGDTENPSHLNLDDPPKAEPISITPSIQTGENINSGIFGWSIPGHAVRTTLAIIIAFAVGSTAIYVTYDNKIISTENDRNIVSASNDDVSGEISQKGLILQRIGEEEKPFIASGLAEKALKLIRRKWRVAGTPAQAAAMIDQAIAYDNKNPRAWLAKAYLDVRQATPLNRSNRANLIRRAVLTSRKAVEFGSDDSSAHYLLAYSLWLNGDSDSVLREANYAIALKSTYSSGYYALALGMVAKGRIVEAIPILDKAINLGTSGPVNRLASFYNMRALAFVLLKNYDAALLSANKAISLNPRLFTAEVTKIAALAQSGKLNKAKEIFINLKNNNMIYKYINFLRRFNSIEYRNKLNYFVNSLLLVLPNDENISLKN